MFCNIVWSILLFKYPRAGRSIYFGRTNQTAIKIIKVLKITTQQTRNAGKVLLPHVAVLIIILYFVL